MYLADLHRNGLLGLHSMRTTWRTADMDMDMVMLCGVTLSHLPRIIPGLR